MYRTPRNFRFGVTMSKNNALHIVRHHTSKKGVVRMLPAAISGCSSGIPDDWRDAAACVDTSTSVFFEDIWRPTGGMSKAALAVARKMCDNCPVRQQCLVEELQIEGNTAPQFRFGLRGGLTPAQRSSLRRRPIDPTQVDPVSIRTGNLVTMSGKSVGTGAPLPDQGDDWLPRHDLLAKRVVAYMVESVPLGSDMPSAAGLAKKLGARKGDVMRVYVALVEDGTVVPRDDRKFPVFVRKGRVGSVKRWYAPHLKVQCNGSQGVPMSQKGDY